MLPSAGSSVPSRAYHSTDDDPFTGIPSTPLSTTAQQQQQQQQQQPHTPQLQSIGMISENGRIESIKNTPHLPGWYPSTPQPDSSLGVRSCQWSDQSSFLTCSLDDGFLTANQTPTRSTASPSRLSLLVDSSKSSLRDPFELNPDIQSLNKQLSLLSPAQFSPLPSLPTSQESNNSSLLNSNKMDFTQNQGDTSGDFLNDSTCAPNLHQSDQAMGTSAPPPGSHSRRLSYPSASVSSGSPSQDAFRFRTIGPALVLKTYQPKDSLITPTSTVDTTPEDSPQSMASDKRSLPTEFLCCSDSIYTQSSLADSGSSPLGLSDMNAGLPLDSDQVSSDNQTEQPSRRVSVSAVTSLETHLTSMAAPHQSNLSEESELTNQKDEDPDVAVQSTGEQAYAGLIGRMDFDFGDLDSSEAQYDQPAFNFVPLNEPETSCDPPPTLSQDHHLSCADAQSITPSIANVPALPTSPAPRDSSPSPSAGAEGDLIVFDHQRASVGKSQEDVAVTSQSVEDKCTGSASHSEQICESQEDENNASPVTILSNEDVDSTILSKKSIQSIEAGSTPDDQPDAETKKESSSRPVSMSAQAVPVEQPDLLDNLPTQSPKLAPSAEPVNVSEHSSCERPLSSSDDMARPLETKAVVIETSHTPQLPAPTISNNAVPEDFLILAGLDPQQEAPTPKSSSPNGAQTFSRISHDAKTNESNMPLSSSGEPATASQTRASNSNGQPGPVTLTIEDDTAPAPFNPTARLSSSSEIVDPLLRASFTTEAALNPSSPGTTDSSRPTMGEIISPSFKFARSASRARSVSGFFKGVNRKEVVKMDLTPCNAQTSVVKSPETEKYPSGAKGLTKRKSLSAIRLKNGMSWITRTHDEPVPQVPKTLEIGSMGEEKLKIIESVESKPLTVEKSKTPFPVSLKKPGLTSEQPSHREVASPTAPGEVPNVKTSRSYRVSLAAKRYFKNESQQTSPPAPSRDQLEGSFSSDHGGIGYSPTARPKTLKKKRTIVSQTPPPAKDSKLGGFISRVLGKKINKPEEVV